MRIDLTDWATYQLQGLEWNPQNARWLIANTKCQGCLGCCDGTHYPAINLSKRDAMRISKKERRTMTEAGDGLLIMEAPCRFMVEGRCAIHVSKPAVCVEYPVSYNEESPWVMIIACPAEKELINTCVDMKNGVTAVLYRSL